jgi:APA family basic amino acid/polyamine antiporter
MGQKGIFLREATGLVREFSLLDAVYTGLSILNVLVGVPAVFLAMFLLFPQVNLGLAFVVGFLVSLATATIYGFLGATMPRSGGDYVWTTRVLGGLVGFANNFALFVVFVATAISYVAFEFSSFFLSSTFEILGALHHNSKLIFLGNYFGQSIPSFIVGSILLILMFIASIFGLRIVKKVQLVLATIMIIGTFAVIYLFATTSNSYFIKEFNSYSQTLGSTYQDIILTATKYGWKPIAPTLLGAFLPLVFVLNMYGGFQLQAMMGGEIKKATRNLPLSEYLSLGIGFVMWGGLAFVLLHPIGRSFFQAISYLYGNYPSVYSSMLTLPPTLNTFISIMSSNNQLLFWIIVVGFVASFLVFPLALFQVLTRMLFAWSFDRIIPGWFGKVSERFHSPFNSLLFSFIISEFFLAIYAFGSWAYAYINWTLLVGLVGIPWGIAAILFPIKTKEIYKRAPDLVKKSVLGIPLISIAGFIVATSSAFAVYFDLTTPAYSGPVAPLYLVLTVIPYVLAIAIFLISKHYNRRKGFDISLAFKNIPPE